jgi:hypothetical protein
VGVKRSRIVLVVAIVAVLAVLISVAAIVIRNQQASASCSSSDASLVSMFGKITLPEGTLGSNLSLTVINTTCEPIVGIAVTSVEPPINGTIDAPFVLYNQVLVSPTSPLPAKEVGTGTVPVTGVVSGREYTLMVTVRLGSGTASQTQTLEIYPEPPT